MGLPPLDFSVTIALQATILHILFLGVIFWDSFPRNPVNQHNKLVSVHNIKARKWS